MIVPDKAGTPPATGGPGVGGGLSTQGEAPGCPTCRALRALVDDLNRQLDGYCKLLLDCHQVARGREPGRLCDIVDGSGACSASPDCAELLQEAARRLGQPDPLAAR